MTDLAAVDQQRAPQAPPRISHRIKRAIDALVTGEAKTQTEAAKIANLAQSHFCRYLKKPHIEAFFARRTRETIARAQMRAGARIVQMIDAASEHVSLDASKYVLAVNGIAPPQSPAVSVNINDNRVGYVLDLQGARGPLIEHDANEQAKPLTLLANVPAIEPKP